MKTKLQIDTTFNQSIEEVVLKAYPLFNLFGWTWTGSIPTPSEMRQKLTEMVEDILDPEKDYKEVSTGRFTVRLCNDGLTQYIEISLDLATLYDDRIT
jgi:hypothetical protein